MKTNTSIILLVIAVGLFFTFTNPKYQEVKNLQKEAGEYRQVLDSTERIMDTVALLSASYQDIPKEELDRLSKVLPPTLDTVGLALDLDTIASKHGIAIRNVAVVSGPGKSGSLVGGDPDSPVGEKTISFSFISNYEDFRSFLDDLETSLRIIDVKSVTFATNDAGLYQHNISVDTYWLK